MPYRRIDMEICGVWIRVEPVRMQRWFHDGAILPPWQSRQSNASAANRFAFSASGWLKLKDACDALEAQGRQKLEAELILVSE
jgi:hypothetical protein